MPHLAIVIDDPGKAHAAQIAVLAAAYQRAGLREAEARRRAEADTPPPQAGDLWTTADQECPDGLPNCRHCGDPAHSAACAAAAHCPHCGTRHGIAPASVLAAKGLVLKALAGQPVHGQEWDRVARAFVPRPAGAEG